MKSVLEPVSPKYGILRLEDLWKAFDIPPALHRGPESQVVVGLHKAVVAGQKPQVSQNPTYTFLPNYAFPKCSKNEMALFLPSQLPLSFNFQAKDLWHRENVPSGSPEIYKLFVAVRLVPESAKSWRRHHPSVPPPQESGQNQHTIRIRISSRFKTGPHTREKVKDWVVTYHLHFINFIFSVWIEFTSNSNSCFTVQF